MSSEELPESELGTQEYWDSLYKTELTNFKDHNDLGEVWFGETIADRIVRWMDKNVLKTSTILDIGCGNGLLLVELSRVGFHNLIGIDYSEDAIVLAKEISNHYKTSVNFTIGDVLKLQQTNIDVILDKGTYDAISLSSEAKKDRQTYISNVYNCMNDNGLLVITSCNWTKEELIQHFIVKFSVFDTIPTPQFQFGGKVGNVVSSLILQKV